MRLYRDNELLEMLYIRLQKNY